MALGGDCIELVHEQTYMDQVVNNVYYFEAINSDALLSQLAAWFETNVVPDIKAFQGNGVTHTVLRLRNLFNLAEVWVEPLTGTGALVPGTGELPSFVAAGIKLTHSNALVRPGYKRYVGLTEAQMGDGFWEPATGTAIAFMAGNLVNPPADANANWAHVIVNRICDIPNPVPNAVPSCLKYRLPENQGEFNPGYPTGWAVMYNPTSQNSRKWYT